MAVVEGRAEVVVEGAVRSATRAWGGREGGAASLGCRTGAACGRAGADAAGWSAGRVTVPFRLKFCSSLGPIVSVTGVLVVGGAAGAVAVWASALVGATQRVPASNTAIPRKIALIRSRS
jgi:hypothetical protein